MGVPVLPGDGSGSGGGGSGGNGSGGGGSPTPLTVELVVSNPTPGLGEEVVLTCVLTPRGDAELMYSFQPSDRLMIDSRRGTARFIVEVTDLGVSLSFRCTAFDGGAVDVRSSSVTVIPSP